MCVAQYRAGEVSRSGRQAAESHFVSTVSAEGGRPAADVKVFLVDSMRYESDGFAKLVASLVLCVQSSADLPAVDYS